MSQSSNSINFVYKFQFELLRSINRCITAKVTEETCKDDLKASITNRVKDYIILTGNIYKLYYHQEKQILHVIF